MHKELCKAEVRIKIWQQLVIQHAKFDDGRCHDASVKSFDVE